MPAQLIVPQRWHFLRLLLSIAHREFGNKEQPVRLYDLRDAAKPLSKQKQTFSNCCVSALHHFLGVYCPETTREEQA